MTGGPTDSRTGTGIIVQSLLVLAIGLAVVLLIVVTALLTSDNENLRLIAAGLILIAALAATGFTAYRRRNRTAISDSLTHLAKRDEPD